MCEFAFSFRLRARIKFVLELVRRHRHAMSYLRHGGEVRIPGDLVDDQCAVFHVIRVDVTQAPVVLDVLRQM